MKQSEILADVPSEPSNDDTAYSKTALQAKFGEEIFEELTDNLVVVGIQDEHGWLKFCFMEFNHSDDTDTYYNQMWYGEGPTGLRECRHSWIGDDGYVFYINKLNFVAALEWLEKRYDLE